MYVTIPSDFAVKKPVAEVPQDRLLCPEIRLKAGAYLFLEEDEVEKLYLVTKGVLRLTRLLENGRRQVISFGFPGDIVGFPSGGRHHTDCEVLRDAVLQPYSLEALRNCRSDPDLHRILLEAALAEISAMQDHFMMLGRKSAIEKMASFLCVLSERVGEEASGKTHIDLPMSRGDIADFLGLTTETVSRTLTQLRKSRIIEIENIHRIILLRPKALLGLSLRLDD